MNNHNYELWCKLDISTFHNNVMVLTIRPHIFGMQIIKTDHLDNLDPLDHLDNHKPEPSGARGPPGKPG